MMTFDNLNLHALILKALTKAGYKQPTQIQLEAIPKIMLGHDIRASAQTGTGKTAAFLLPAVNHLISTTKEGKGPRILILVPTRELAMQIAVQADKYSQHAQQIKTVCVVGGIPYVAQVRKLNRPYDILIATPGRLLDFMEQGKISFSRVEMLILDEADRMLDMGFSEPVEHIVSQTPKRRQTLLFSATLQGSVIQLSDKLLTNPLEIAIKPTQEGCDHIKQSVHYTDDLLHKNKLLDHILEQEDVQCAFIFTSTKRQAEVLAKQLQEKKHLVAALHGDMNQRKRIQTIARLKNGKIKILVATDVAARGIDIQAISHVINFDLPNNVEDYIHRIGRTGRAGAKGTALSFVSNRDGSLIKKIEEFTKQPIKVVEIEGLEPQMKPQPAQKKSRRPKFSSSFKNKTFNPKAPKRKFSQKRNFKKPAAKHMAG